MMSAATAVVLFHLEATDEGTPVWWAESDALPGFTAAAPSLAEVRALVLEALPGGFAEALVNDGGDRTSNDVVIVYVEEGSPR